MTVNPMTAKAITADHLTRPLPGPGGVDIHEEAAIAAAEAIAAEAAARIAIEAGETAAAMVAAAVAAAGQANARARQTAESAAAVAQRSATDVVHEAAATADAMVIAASVAAEAVLAAGGRTFDAPSVDVAAAVVEQAAAVAEVMLTTAREAAGRAAARAREVSAAAAEVATQACVGIVEEAARTAAEMVSAATAAATVAAVRAGTRAREEEFSRSVFQASFEQAPTALLIVAVAPGVPASFRFANAAMGRLTGFNPKRLIGLSFADLARRDNSVAGVDFMDQLGASKAHFVLRWIRADGQLLWVRLRSARIGNEGTAGWHMLCEVEDISAVVLGPLPDDAVRRRGVPPGTQGRVRPATAGLIDQADARDRAAEVRDHDARDREKELIQDFPRQKSRAQRMESALAHDMIDRIHAARDRDCSASDRADLLDVIVRLD